MLVSCTSSLVRISIRNTHSIVSLGGDGPAGSESGGEVECLGELLYAASDAERAERGSETGAVGKEAYPLTLKLGAVDVADEGGETAPNATAVHVTAEGRDLDGGVDALLEALLGESHEGLLNDLVGQGLLIVHVANLARNLGKDGALGVGKVVVVKEASIRLLDELAGRGVEGKVVEAVQGGLGAVLGVAVDTLGEELLALVVGAVGTVKSLGVAVDGVVAIDVGVLAGQVGLVEIVGVGHVAAAETGLDSNRGVRADKHGDAAGTTGRAGIALGVESDITGDNNGVTAVPGGGLDPVDGVEESVGTTVAGVDGIDTLDVGVLAEKLHQDGLDGLGLVEKGLGTDLEAADRVGVDLIVLEETGDGSQGERVDVCRRMAKSAPENARRGMCWNGRKGENSPSRSSQKAILVWPRPIVYLPALTPSNFSSSDCSTY